MPQKSLAGAALTALLFVLTGCGRAAATREHTPDGATSAAENERVVLSASQLRFVSLQPVNERTFTPQQEVVGNIDFDADRTVQVSPPYQGRVVRLFAAAGDRVKKGQLLFTLDSPDLVQAESNLIATAGTLKLADSVLERARGLVGIQGIPQKEYEQAVSDQQVAAAAYEAAREAVHIFGKTDSDMDRILTQKRFDAEMPVASPISGVVTARNAAPGTLVQPGAIPSPYAVADLTDKWLLAQVPESDLPGIHLGQPVVVRLLAHPARVLHGTITNVAEAVDPNTHRATVRSVVSDPDDELHAQMLATFSVQTGSPMHALAVPAGAIVREGDGTMSVWVTADERLFTRRTVRIGQQEDGFDAITHGLNAGERVASSGALFISNASIRGAGN